MLQNIFDTFYTTAAYILTLMGANVISKSTAQFRFSVNTHTQLITLRKNSSNFKITDMMKYMYCCNKNNTKSFNHPISVRPFIRPSIHVFTFKNDIKSSIHPISDYTSIHPCTHQSIHPSIHANVSSWSIETFW